MGLFEFFCPLTGEKQRIRTSQPGETPTPFYSAGASKEAIDQYEKAERAQKREPAFRRHPHQV